ncbi:ABC transporter B family member 20 [Vitis vinifera]|uniref:ABC transporter B family member 20 n=1 Tax=Vitis vinifera TaxID=29760 RepID=A0A438ENV3_VITVI|nr:ABC transporter B family member 20 [Vitis vinifera]
MALCCLRKYWCCYLCSFNPLLAYVIALIVTAYYRGGEGGEHSRDDRRHLRQEVDKWCLIIACMGVVTVVANFLQHFYFAMLRNEVGWFDEEDNSADTLSMRLANDATFVRAAFSNRLSIFIQDSAAVIVAVLIGMLLGWRLALVALATLPILTVSAFAQKLWLAGFSRGIQEMHRKASLVLEDAVRNIYTVVASVLATSFFFLPAMLFSSGTQQSLLKTSIWICLQLSRSTCNETPNVFGTIELKNVDFCYPTRPEVLVLSNFSLKVSGGQTVAVVGVSGSGKSTIISLIERFYDPVAGQVSLDGRDLKSYNLRWLRNHLGLVQQEPIIFSTTIRENIIYARHNANLTPGQKQRIAIARVVLKNAPILLLDEASSSIESESSRVVQEALDTLIMGNKNNYSDSPQSCNDEAC